MTSVGYGTGTIKFVPNNKQSPSLNYSQRSLIEVLQLDIGGYSLRACDLDNKKEKIFDFQFKNSDFYKFAHSPNQRDEIRHNDGTYYVSLNQHARTQFHKALRQCFELLESKNQQSADVDSGRSSENKTSTGLSDTRTNVNEKTIFVEIHNLSEYIQQGEANKADELIKKLIKSGVQLQVKHLKETLDEQTFPIRIKIDGFDSDITDLNKFFDVDVYPSTTVHELRAFFEYTLKFPLANQYFFVNGHLAHAESTMNDLKVKNGSLFVLFLIKK
ncbi:unnamed protein product [Rotaria sordida]|uniref:Ubiquitin-like domain-containing protein n=1 Tax=Rotaria sordida TaxID=392033 RepID=A0A814FKZ9_9BILA|nr:unnamed protein product [Rotaria sordida]